jgi:hypothetical protein
MTRDHNDDSVDVRIAESEPPPQLRGRDEVSSKPLANREGFEQAVQQARLTMAHSVETVRRSQATLDEARETLDRSRATREQIRAVARDARQIRDRAEGA